MLSKHSVESKWCKKELSSALLKELEKENVFVLPVLLEDCDIPLFLRGKLYADFREDFDAGFSTVLEGIARFVSDSQGRVSKKGVEIDWGMDWGTIEQFYMMRFIVVEHSLIEPITIVTQIELVANEKATDRFNFFEEKGYGWFGRSTIIEAISLLKNRTDLKFLLEDSFPHESDVEVKDSKTEMAYKLKIECRRLGMDTGKNILYNYGNLFGLIRDDVKATIDSRQHEMKEIVTILSTNPL